MSKEMFINPSANITPSNNEEYAAAQIQKQRSKRAHRRTISEHNYVDTVDIND